MYYYYFYELDLRCVFAWTVLLGGGEGVVGVRLRAARLRQMAADLHQR